MRLSMFKAGLHYSWQEIIAQASRYRIGSPR